MAENINKIIIQLEKRGFSGAGNAIKSLSGNLNNLKKSFGTSNVKISEASKKLAQVAAPAKKVAQSLAQINANKTANRFASLSKSMKTLGLNMSKVNKYLYENNILLSKNGKFMDKATGKAMKHSEVLKASSKRARGFQMEYLGLLFAGMALQRLFKQLSFTTVNFYRTMTEGQTEAGVGMTRLVGAWQFLKF